MFQFSCIEEIPVSIQKGKGVTPLKKKLGLGKGEGARGAACLGRGEKRDLFLGSEQVKLKSGGWRHVEERMMCGSLGRAGDFFEGRRLSRIIRRKEGFLTEGGRLN